MPWGHGTTGSWHRLGPGNTNVLLVAGYPVYPYPVPTHPYTSRTAPHRPYPPLIALPASTGATGHAHMTGLTSAKEILGVDNAQLHYGLARSPHGCLTHGPAASLSPPVGPCCSL